MKHLRAAPILAAALLLAAACQTTGPAGEATGRNRTGAPFLAQVRSSSGLPALAQDAGLERAALEQARFMAESGKMEHTTGFRRSFARRMRIHGIGGAAENIAHGAFGPDELFRRWMDSPPHRRNMLDPSYTRFGLASAKEAGSDRNYWALVLAK